MNTFKRQGGIIVFCSMMMVMVSISICVSCWGTLTTSICEDLSISRQQFGIIYSAIFLGRMVSSLLLGTLVTKIKPKKIMTFGAFAIPATLAAMSQVKGISEFYFFSVSIGLFMPTTSFFMISLLMANWFVKQRGAASGIAFMGSGIGGLILIPLTNYLNLTFGWRSTVLVLAGICGVVLPLASRAIVFDPEEIGLYPDGESSRPEGSRADKESGQTLRTLLGSPKFWLFLVFVSASYSIVPLTAVITPYLEDLSYPNGFITIVYSVSTGSIAVCRMLCGALCDKLGGIKSTMITATLSMLLMLGLLWIPSVIEMSVFIIIGVGMCNALASVCIPLIVNILYGQREFSKINGLAMAVGELSGVMCPVIYGKIYSRIGTYAPSFVFFLVYMLIGILCCLRSVK